MKTAFTFDDVSLVPKLSTMESRSDSDLTTVLGDLRLKIPVLSSPMDSVTELDMAMFMSYYGGLGIIHRFMTVERQCEIVSQFIKETDSTSVMDIGVGAAVGVNGDSWERINRLVDAGVRTIMLDVAHGHTTSSLEMINRIKSYFSSLSVISGSICTFQAARDCINAGVDVLRVGVGGGSACTTRVVAGVGVPQLQAIMECYKATRLNDVQIIADGGIKNSGHAVKALAAGADAVMLGGMLAGYPVSAAPTILIETGKQSGLGDVIRGWVDRDKEDAREVFQAPVEFDFGNEIVKKKVFRGMASDAALSEYKKDERYTVEGDQFLIDLDNDFENSFTTFLGGIELGMAYLGAKTIPEMHDKAEFVHVTPNGFVEATPHGKEVN